MNGFNNNVPNLSASDRIRDKKARSIYKTTAYSYKNSSKCNNYNGKIGFYPGRGTLRNTNSYETFLDLNRGYALCVDGAADPVEISMSDVGGQTIDRGLEACARRNVSAGAKVKLVNGPNSIYNVFHGFSFGRHFGVLSGNVQAGIVEGFPVIKVWPPPTGGCEDWDPLKPFTKDASFNELGYPMQNVGGCGLVIDPSNILFGADTCTSSDRATNKYLAFSETQSYVVASGQLFDNQGQVIPCGQHTVTPGMIAIGGVGAITGSPALADAPTPGSTPTWRQLFMANFFTGLGRVERVCCGNGPNGEPNWWRIYIKIIAGAIPVQDQMPLTLTIPAGQDPWRGYETALGGTGATGGQQVQIGGIWKTGELTVSSLVAAAEGQGNNPGGGGLAFFESAAPIREGLLPNPALPPTHATATMGWSGDTSSAAGATGAGATGAFAPGGVWTIQPYVIVKGAGSCLQNLLFGNNTKQNYLVSYDPGSKNVRFNVDDKLLREF